MGAIFKLSSTGDWSKTNKFLDFLMKQDIESVLSKYGEMGVNALANATPVDTGLASSQWRYEVHKTFGGYVLSFHNDDIEHGYNVALLIQYGHGLKNGGYVPGRDYINPTLKPIFDSIVEDAWKEVNAN